MSEIILVRHGQCFCNTMKLASSWFDDALTELGQEQAKEAGLKLRDFGATMIYCSSMLRTRQTAYAINHILELPLTFSDFIREKNYGPFFVPMSYGELAEKSKKKAILRGRGFAFDFRPYYGESIKDVMARLELGMREVRQYAVKDEKVLVVTHSGIIRILLKIYAGVESNPDNSLPNAGLSFIDVDQDIDWRQFDKNVLDEFSYVNPPTITFEK